MVSEKLFTQTLMVMGEIFNKEVTKSLLKTYWGALKEMDESEFLDKAAEIITRGRFFPKPADFLEESDEAVFVEAKQVFNDFREALRENGVYKNYTSNNALLVYIIGQLGGIVGINVDVEQMRFIERDFIKAYISYKKSKIAPEDGIVLRGLFGDSNDVVVVETIPYKGHDKKKVAGSKGYKKIAKAVKKIKEGR